MPVFNLVAWKSQGVSVRKTSRSSVKAGSWLKKAQQAGIMVLPNCRTATAVSTKCIPFSCALKDSLRLAQGSLRSVTLVWRPVDANLLLAANTIALI